MSKLPEARISVRGKTTTRFDFGPTGGVVDVTIDHEKLAANFAQMFLRYARSGHGKRAKITSQYGAIVARSVKS